MIMLCELNNKYYILLLDSDDPDYYINDIYKLVSLKYGTSFKIIIDCILRTGISPNRFLEFEYKNKIFIKSCIENMENIDRDIIINTNNILKENMNLLESSLLTKREKDKIINDFLFNK